MKPAAAIDRPARRQSLSLRREVAGWRISHKIGEGRTAEVYLARGRDGGAVALKIIKRHGSGAGIAAQAFPAECAALAGIEHEHVVRVVDYGIDGGVSYLAMEHLGGGSLREAMREGVDPGRAVSLLRQAASALAALHGQGIVHRDVKPENCLFRAGGALVLADFGLAAALSGTAAPACRGAAAGTPRYTCPEQAQADVPLPSWDVYSLGIVFFEMLCGHRPFPGETLLEIRAQHARAPIPRLPAPLARYQFLIDGMLGKQAHRRIRDGGALLAEIGRLERASPGQESSLDRAARTSPC